jgi:hypothetical protein
LGLILLGVVLLLNVMIALVRHWRERSEMGEGSLQDAIKGPTANRVSKALEVSA